MKTVKRPFVLIILDGWGHRDALEHNPILKVATPVLDDILKHYPHTLLDASGIAVGLPEGQMGNSEVGHLHLGSGRKVPQDLTRIDADIATKNFEKNPVFTDAIATAKKYNSTIHILGLISPGGVHSHENHIKAIINLIEENHVPCYLHAILDGRDTPPQSALPSLQKFDNIATIIGRYYAMDRDKRWPRTEKAYELYTEGKADYQAESAEAALKMAYERGENDEFVHATRIQKNNQAPVIIKDNDIVIFMNFRADRARQLSHAFLDREFDGFVRKTKPKLAKYITLTQYAKDLDTVVAYPKLTLKNTLGEFLSKEGFTQLRIAETEKYAHVTYFFNGGIEKAFPHEDRALIPSPQVATYDLQPEMSAPALTDKICEALDAKNYDMIICNFANPDMVGHTGNEKAAEAAVSVIDDCIGRIFKHCQKANGEMMITADHGNIEKMFDEKTKQPHTAHTSNRVPLIYIGRPAHFIYDHGALDDVAPTIIHLLGLAPPNEMTGKNLLLLQPPSES